MRTLIVDSKVIWSTAYNAKSEIGQFVLSVSPKEIQLYAPEFLRDEIERHFLKIVELSGQTEGEVRAVLALAYERSNSYRTIRSRLSFISRAFPMSEIPI